MPRSLQGRLVFSVFVILAWFGLIAEGAHALYTDTANLAGNTISSGSTDLLISNSQSASSTTFAESRAGFSFALSPGQSDEKYFLLKNASTSNMSLDIDVAAGNSAGAADIANAVQIEFTPVDGSGSAVGPSVSRVLAYYLNNRLDLGTSIDRGISQRYKIRASMQDTYVGIAQSLSYDLVFTGTQHVGS